MNYLRAIDIAAGVAASRLTATDMVEETLARIEAQNPAINAFTHICADRARARAVALDTERSAGADMGPLAGVPFAAKNLFDVAGQPTIAGSRLHAKRSPASQDAFAIRALEAAGAILVGTLNMDEFASGFTTENTHYGPTRNPHDTERMAGGSSGGSAAAVAAGLVPFTLGSDTNGSIRVPAAACGVFGLKPTYGRLSRSGATLFAESFDHIGPLAAHLNDLALAYDTLQGPDPDDPVQAPMPPSPVAAISPGQVRAGLAAGSFFERCDDEGLALAQTAAEALGGANRPIMVPDLEAGWAASLVITLIEGSSVHIADLKADPMAFDPMTRDRFLAGALAPAETYLKSQRVRRHYRDGVMRLFADLDVLVTPGAPFPAPPIGCDRLDIAGHRMNPRGDFGRFTQPFSVIGLPALAVPMAGTSALPRTIQLVAAPWREDMLFRAARVLEREGLSNARMTEGTAWA